MNYDYDKIIKNKAMCKFIDSTAAFGGVIEQQLIYFDLSRSQPFQAATGEFYDNCIPYDEIDYKDSSDKYKRYRVCYNFTEFSQFFGETIKKKGEEVYKIINEVDFNKGDAEEYFKNWELYFREEPFNILGVPYYYGIGGQSIWGINDNS